MRVPLAQQAQESLGQSDLVIITERVDDGGPTHRADGQDGLAGGLGPAYPASLDATGAQLGVDSGDLAGLYPHGRRPSESVGGNLPQGDAPHPEPPDGTGHRAAGFS